MASRVASEIADLKEVRSLLELLEKGTRATAAGVYDNDLGKLHAWSGPSSDAFWEDLVVLGCLLDKVDWDDWYRELRSAKHRRETCDCGGGHALHGFLIHDRWALMVVAGRPLAPYAASLIFSTTMALARHLSQVRARPPRRRRGGPGPEHARVGIPVWWMIDGKLPPRE